MLDLIGAYENYLTKVKQASANTIASYMRDMRQYSDWLQEKGVDVAVLDGTIGFVDGDHRVFEHCNMNMIIEIQKSLKESVGKFYISHMARTLHTDHDTLSAAMDKYDIGVAYDGMEIII